MHRKVEKRATFAHDNIAESNTAFPVFEYEVSFDDLEPLNWNQLSEWENNNKNSLHPLIYLYDKYLPKPGGIYG